MSSLLDLPGLDTRLARALHLAGRVDVQVLGESLAQVRATRHQQGATLARELLARGVLREEELEDTLQGLAGARHEAWREGAELAGLRIVRLLGSGGMGSVYLATDLETGAEVAVKSLALGDPELLERFDHEAQAQARVDRHPSIIRVHRAGVAGGRAFLVLDVASGGDLEGRLREQGPLPPAEAARLVASLARGLAHAHARGVLHRDLKPANVLFDESGAPKLTDFGLARLLDLKGLTQTGEILGTPAYMAPEQALGLSQDERTDVYGLGGVLFAALTGRAPFQKGHLLQALDAVVNEAPPSPRDLNPEVPAELSELCLRCLAKDPAERFSSAEELAAALLRGQERSPAGSRSGLLALVLVLGVGSALALGLATAFGGDSPPPRSASRPASTPSPQQVKRRDFQAEHDEAPDPAARANVLEAALFSDPGNAWARKQARQPLWERPLERVRHVRVLAHDRVAVALADPDQPSHELPRVKNTYVLSSRTGERLGVLRGEVKAVSPAGTRLALYEGASLRILAARTLEEDHRLSQAGLGYVEFMGEETLLVSREAPHQKDPRLTESTLQLLELGAPSPALLSPRPLALRGLVRVDDSTFVVLTGSPFATTPTVSLVHLERGELWRSGSLGLSRGFSLSPARDELAIGTNSGGLFLFPIGAREPGPAPTKTTLLDEKVRAVKELPRAADCIVWPREDVLLVLQPLGEGHLVKVWRREGSTWGEQPRRFPAPGWRMWASHEQRQVLFSHQSKGLWQHLVSGFAPECAREQPVFGR